MVRRARKAEVVGSGDGKQDFVCEDEWSGTALVVRCVGTREMRGFVNEKKVWRVFVD